MAHRAPATTPLPGAQLHLGMFRFPIAVRLNPRSTMLFVPADQPANFGCDASFWLHQAGADISDPPLGLGRFY